MPSNKAWQRHGCYHLGSDAIFDFPLGKALLGCQDDWNSLDHFDPTADVRRLYKQFFDLRVAYPALNDGFSLVQNGNRTHEDFLPFSSGTPTERGLWSVSRGGLSPLQNFTYNDTVWLLYTNENTTVSYDGGCVTSSGIAGPYQGNTVVRNLLYPFESYTLGSSNQSFLSNGGAPYFGCIESITMQPYGFKALVPTTNWVAPVPALTEFIPGHDARIQVDDNSTNPNSTAIRIEFSDLMDCNSVTQSMNFTLASSGKGSTPSVNVDSIQCQTIPDDEVTPTDVLGAALSRWFWSGTIENVADGILTITINNPQNQNGLGTGVSYISIDGFCGGGS
jgi:alpha-1,3-glucan synthase